FVDSRWNRIFRIDCESGAISLVRDVPQKPLCLFFDTCGSLIVICEYRCQSGATMNGAPMKFTKKADAKGTSYGDWYYPDAAVIPYAINPADPENTMRILPKVKTGTITRTAQSLHPANRWRDDNTYLTATVVETEECFLAPDGVTVIPDFYDLIRASAMSAAKPGEKFYAADEYYKRVISFDVKDNGMLENPAVFAEHGEYCVVKDEKSGKIYAGEGNILVFDEKGELVDTLRMPKRAGTMAIGGANKDVLFVTAIDSVYAIRLK
ncbi:MAG: SMP-30/gluconolactonase/LRE family protein, partial [Lachnospiraceae bacterium]|nr:SMP-30/gluconolactonase/LRE family protein [Lachnospiraceae bacterium]